MTSQLDYHKLNLKHRQQHTARVRYAEIKTMVPELKLGLPHEQTTIMTLKLMVTPNHN